MTLPPEVQSESEAVAARRLAREIARRRTFAIISHPDAGKTTLTEKLLLYGGAIHLAGAVKARRAQRHAVSDWMQLEQERGISVTSSAMQFEYDGFRINLLDTPGHEDFSEDTYRTLVAADSAVMLLDNRKGVEERTRQLFAVCRRHRTPIFTFVNKCDRVGEDPLRIVSDVEADLGIHCHPVTWPIVRDGQFAGVYDRRQREIHLFDRDIHHGAREAPTNVRPIDGADVPRLLGEAAHAQLRHDIQLLDEAGHPFSEEAVTSGELTPVFFGSALTNFGVEPFLREFLELAPPPRTRESTAGPIEPTHKAFTGFVFKIQANMDPKHRDRVAFVRVCSGHFTAGMDVTHVRTGKSLRLSSPQQFLARERSGIEEAWPGDVIGIMDRGTVRIGDTLSAAGEIEFAGIPRFPPERFARAVPLDPLRRKQFDRGLRELTEEGAAQVFYTETEAGPAPIVGAVGMLQFDVMRFRLEHEYGAPCRFEPISHRFPRWVTGNPQRIRRLAAGGRFLRVYDAAGHPMLLFEDEWTLRRTLQEETDVVFHETPP